MREIIFDIETNSTLEPFENGARIIAIGVKCGDYEEVLMSHSERNLLIKFWNLPFFQEDFKLIGFNPSQFDIPFLIVRSFRYGIKIPNLGKNIIDLKLILNFWNKNDKGSIIDYSKLILGKEGDNLIDNDSSKFKELWNKGKYEQIKHYCKQDILLTYKIHERLKQMEIL